MRRNIHEAETEQEPKRLTAKEIKKELKILMFTLGLVSHKLEKEGRHFELGGDSEYAYEIYAAVFEIRKNALVFESQFQLGYDHPKKVNTYYELIGNLDNLVALAEKIYRSRYGTEGKTRSVIEQITNCYAVIEKLLN